MTDSSLGEFLRARRAQVDPHDAGLPWVGGRRRVAGLRREELAQLAGVSASYYTRLEQGQSVNASDAVLDAIARALGLDDHERQHLHTLAGVRHVRPTRSVSERVDPMTRDLLDSLTDLPALVVGLRLDVLAWNPLAHALLAGHLDVDAVDRPAERPNLARMLFLDCHTRDLYVDWQRKARAVVGNLRLVAGRHPDDPALAALIGELSMKSPEFVALWRDHRVKPCEADSYRLRHPTAGPLTVTQHNLAVARSTGQSVCIVTAVAGSASADTLGLLAGSLGERSGSHPAPADR
ncbi:transcriptional regulator [Mycolicibacterium sp. P1-18]|uniref:helix-turn-helix transcriptional regulator n=1 Tax=Mycolicibacterium sp. P1-18 TaxID=2024615 RepID=UPI0011F0CBD6|nr:helix-turn-helix transcriptional regulator [Mycolicibacterium sp. P1-18]KAA0098760.1 transcriptional regulator [Mycolicibacterium sp. P1-18]